MGRGGGRSTRCRSVGSVRTRWRGMELAMSSWSLWRSGGLTGLMGACRGGGGRLAWAGFLRGRLDWREMTHGELERGTVSRRRRLGHMMGGHLRDNRALKDGYLTPARLLLVHPTEERESRIDAVPRRLSTSPCTILSEGLPSDQAGPSRYPSGCGISPVRGSTLETASTVRRPFLTITSRLQRQALPTLTWRLE